MPEIVAVPKKRDDTARNVGIGSGAAAIAAGYIDRRKKIETPKHLGNSWESIKNKIQPGDMLIGAPALPHEALKRDFSNIPQEYRKSKEDIGLLASGKSTKHYEAKEYRSSRKKFKFLPKNLRTKAQAAHAAAQSISLPTHLSKAIDPYYSHGEMVISPTQSAFAGGFKSRIKTGVVPANEKEFRKMIRSGQSPHYTIVRPAEGSSEYAKMYAKNPSAAKAHVTRSIGSQRLSQSKIYKTRDAIIAGLKEFVLPKLRSSERNIPQSKLRAQMRCTGGVCSTLGARYSSRTVGGKTVRNVLPADYLRSKEWKVIGEVGGKRKIPLRYRMLSSSPKYLAKGLAGAAVGLGAYGATKAIRHLRKDPGISKESSMNEIVAVPIEGMAKEAAPIGAFFKNIARWGDRWAAAVPGRISAASRAARRSARQDLVVGARPFRERLREASQRYSQLQGEASQLASQHQKQFGGLSRRMGKAEKAGIAERIFSAQGTTPEASRVGGWLKQRRMNRLGRLQSQAEQMQSAFKSQRGSIYGRMGAARRQSSQIGREYDQARKAMRSNYQGTIRDISRESARQRAGIETGRVLRNVAGTGGLAAGAVAVPVAGYKALRSLSGRRNEYPSHYGPQYG